MGQMYVGVKYQMFRPKSRGPPSDNDCKTRQGSLNVWQKQGEMDKNDICLIFDSYFCPIVIGQCCFERIVSIMPYSRNS